MKFFCRVGLNALSILACAVVHASPGRSVSTSRQFVVYGEDVRLRGAICDLAERTKREVLQLIDQRDEWTTPIVVNAHYPMANLPEAPHAALSFAQTGFGLKLQLDLTIATDPRQPEVRHEFLRAILLELMYRRRTSLPAGTAYVAPPDWLLDGIPPSQSDFEWPRSMDALGAPMVARKISSLAEFLRPQSLSELDAPGRALHRAYSFALVEFLTRTSNGRGRLARFIADLPAASNDSMMDLGIHFPELNDVSGAEKAWRLHIERLCAARSFHILSAEETEQQLDKLLVVRILNAGQERNYHLDEFSLFVRNASSKPGLIRSSWELSILATRANPMYRSAIYEYEKVAALLARGKTGGIAKQLARLRASRNGIADRLRKIDDYINWFEATKSRRSSGTFTNYLKAAEQASRPERKRRDPISVYLDVLEIQFQN